MYILLMTKTQTTLRTFETEKRLKVNSICIRVRFAVTSQVKGDKSVQHGFRDRQLEFWKYSCKMGDVLSTMDMNWVL